MSDAEAAVWVAIISGVCSVIGVVAANRISSKAQIKKLEEHQQANQKANKEMGEKLETLTGKVESLERHQKDNYLGVLRLEIMSEEMPVEERIIAGNEYIKNGGNGKVKEFYQAFIKEHTK